MYIGIMSGTSLDGIDMVAATFGDHGATIHHQAMYSFPSELKEKLIALSQGEPITLDEIGTIDHFLGKTYAEAVNRFLAEHNLSPEAVTAIGCHGQTVFHKPSGPMPFTMQLGDANIIAALTGITTVADFRRKDMALGGQGAPLVPAFHRFLFGTEGNTKVVLNIGGIANISVLETGKPVLGFDTGPGNMLMDSWVSEHCGEPYDKDGQWAASGTVNPASGTNAGGALFLSARTEKHRTGTVPPWMAGSTIGDIWSSPCWAGCSGNFACPDSDVDCQRCEKVLSGRTSRLWWRGSELGVDGSAEAGIAGLDCDDNR